MGEVSYIRGEKMLSRKWYVRSFCNKEKNIIFFKKGLAFPISYVSQIKGEKFCEGNCKVGRFLNNKNLFLFTERVVLF